MEITKDPALHRASSSRISALIEKDFVFGSLVAEHMLIAKYVDGQWDNGNIQPYSPLALDPSTSALHYGQSVFEGMKAFRMHDDNVALFRVNKHFERFNRSLKRMHMPAIPADLFVRGLQVLLELDSDWVPYNQGSALYIRPFMFASDTRFGVRPSSGYTFIIFSGPVPAYYSRPLKVKIERDYSRAAWGGTGCAKCAGNYAGSFYPAALAQEEGYDQVLWTDSRSHDLIEESGMMNIFFVINNKLTTPAISTTILDGITRDSLLTLARSMNIQCEERPVSVSEIKTTLENGTLTEAFGCGTAAVAVAISTIGIDGIDYQIPEQLTDTGSMMSVLKSRLENIRSGLEEDIFKWNTIIL